MLYLKSIAYMNYVCLCLNLHLLFSSFKLTENLNNIRYKVIMESNYSIARLVMTRAQKLAANTDNDCHSDEDSWLSLAGPKTLSVFNIWN